MYIMGRVCERFDVHHGEEEMMEDNIEVSGKIVDEKRVVEIVPHPWRRYFARYVDASVYGLVWTWFILFVMRINGSVNTLENLIGIFVGIALMLVIEPLLLSRFGKTLGKWIFGLEVTHLDGGRLTYGEAFQRTLTLIKVGMGYGIPIYSLYRNYKCYQICKDNRLNEWELDCGYHIKDTNNRRIGLFVVALVLVMGINMMATAFAQLPENRGDLTEVEFYENYNDLMDFHDVDYGHELSPEGEWVERSSGDDLIIRLFGEALPVFEVVEADGEVVEVTMVVESTELKTTRGFTSDVVLTYMSFVGAQRGVDIFGISDREVMDYLSFSLEDFEFEKEGVIVSNQVEYSGYEDAGDMLIGLDDEDQFFRMVFRLVKVR